ncbi:hypothetical protein Btru_010679 [Bulinus truncatus]|nr:hypothetical protein Btru_010679 [Bulinus truncatus]
MMLGVCMYEKYNKVFQLIIEKPLIKERHPPINRSPPRKTNAHQIPLDSPPPAPRGHRDNLELKEAMKDKDLKDILGDQQAEKKSKVAPAERKTTNEQQVSEIKKDEKLTKEDQRPDNTRPVVNSKGNQKIDQPKSVAPKKSEESKQQKLAPKMNEAVQTNLRKGIAIATPEAPAEFALQYKAGVAPPRPIQKVSEYQKQFQWRQGLKESPLLTAEQVIYKSQAALGPYKTDGVPRVSEYARQFQRKKPFDIHGDANLNVNNSSVMKQMNTNNNSSESTGQKRRSKSVGAVHHQDELDETVVTQSDSRALKEKLKSTYGKLRRSATEYRANFKPPAKYRYEHGVWRGACPPQLIPQLTSDEESPKDKNNSANNNANNSAANKTVNSNADEGTPLSNWYAEVLELRRRAEEYRRRAQGTHFSREHLVQLLGKQAECWDTHSEASYVIDALNLETPSLSEKPRPQPAKRDESPSSDISSAEASSEASPSPGENDADQGKAKNNKSVKKSSSHLSRKIAWLENQKKSLGKQRRKLNEELSRPPDDDSENEIAEGRLPTPLLKKNQFSPVRRHHLDRTTPSVGGAILTCPPSRSSKMIVTSRSGDSYVTASDDLPVKIKAKSYDVNKLVTLPTLGRPSDDTHPLRDDLADSDKLLQTQYIVSPPLPDSDDEDDKENSATPKQVSCKSKAPKQSLLRTVKEGFGETYIRRSNDKGNSRKFDADVLSDSLSSVASSGSLASDILERSKKRQKFWTKTNGHH